MKKYRVTFPYVCFVAVNVEAENKDDAIDLAEEDAGITGFCGNGGSDKLIGVYGENVSISASEEPIDGFPVKLQIEVEELQQ